MAHTELTLKERRVIARMYEEKRRIVEIAQAISRHRSTIYRELQRNSVRFDDEPYLNGYDHTNAHDQRAWLRPSSSSSTKETGSGSRPLRSRYRPSESWMVARANLRAVET